MDRCCCTCCSPVPSPPGGVWYPDVSIVSGGGSVVVPPEGGGGCSCGGGSDGYPFPPISGIGGFSLSDVVSMTFNGVEVSSAVFNGTEVWGLYSPELSLSANFVEIDQMGVGSVLRVFSNGPWVVENL